MDPFLELENLLAAAADHDDPAARTAKLREYRERLNDLLGEADRRLANSERAREAGASDLLRRRMAARADASLREEAEAKGETGLEEVAAHRTLNDLEEEGLLDGYLGADPGIEVGGTTHRPEADDPESGTDQGYTVS